MSPKTTVQNENGTHTLGVFDVPEQNIWSVLAKLPSELPYRVWRSHCGEYHLCAGVTFSATAERLSRLPEAFQKVAGVFFQDTAGRAGLIALLASAFDPVTSDASDFPPLSIWLPTWTLRRTNDSWTLLVLTTTENFDACAAQALALLEDVPGMALNTLQKASHPVITAVADTDYKTAVRRALAAVSSSHESTLPRVSKIVIARQRSFKSSALFRVPAILAALDARFPNCYVFADRPRPHSPVFLGASPERLLASFDGVLTTEALAGSAPRGRTVEEDAQLGAALFESEKDLREHNHVKAYVEEHLSGVCEDVVFAPMGLKKLANVQHLHTPVTARLKSGRSLLEAAEPLHPTSAVGGEPRETAMQLIRQIEGFDRGWYAGLIGWLEPGQTQNGELCVAIRSAVILGDEAKLFAGAGIVEGSDPDMEDRETCIKMQAIWEALS